jgi:hypothetical protein
MMGMRLGIAHHFGWAIAVTASDRAVVDRRRIKLIEDGQHAAPIHHHGGLHEMHLDGGPPDDEALAAQVSEARASTQRQTTAALDELVSQIPGKIVSMSVRAWPANFPQDITTQRRAPYESRADSVMYCQVLAESAEKRGWAIHLYDPKNIEALAAQVLGDQVHDVLFGPRDALGPPWNKDHRSALAATIVAGSLDHELKGDLP